MVCRLIIDALVVCIALSQSYYVCMACLPVFGASRCPALFLAKDAVLSTFSVAKQTSIVVDSGYSCTTGKRQGNQHAGFQAFAVCPGKYQSDGLTADGPGRLPGLMGFATAASYAQSL